MKLTLIYHLISDDDYYGPVDEIQKVEDLIDLPESEVEDYLESDEYYNLRYKKKSFFWDYAEVVDEKENVLDTFEPRTWHDDIYDELEGLYWKGIRTSKDKNKGKENK